MPIESFSSNLLQLLFRGSMPDEETDELPVKYYPRALEILKRLDSAKSLTDLADLKPSYFKGSFEGLKGMHGIEIFSEFRNSYLLCFRWHGKDAFEVRVAYFE